jgi:hypothetical protein
VILLGPFVDIQNTEIYHGELFYDSEKGKVFVTHEQLFQDLVNMVTNELSGLSTKVVFIPSHRDLMHFETYPMSPF